MAFIILSFFPIPASLGIHDGLQAFSFGAMGLGRGTGIAFTMLLRSADALLALIGTLLLFRLGIDFLRLVFSQKKQNKFYINNTEWGSSYFI